MMTPGKLSRKERVKYTLFSLIALKLEDTTLQKQGFIRKQIGPSKVHALPLGVLDGT